MLVGRSSNAISGVFTTTNVRLFNVANIYLTFNGASDHNFA